MKKTIWLFIAIMLLSLSCDRVRKKAKNTINQTGEDIGKSASEFVDGIADGVEKSIAAKLELDASLQARGVVLGEHILYTTTARGNYNAVKVFMEFNQNFKGRIMVKAINENNKITGRKTETFDLKANEAGYYSFVMDTLTDIRSRATLK
ncbi:MAG: hypothetical protein OIF50_07925, partial [Flavobacteriaceae bacterium]|nr:hypothetical protein [Flavobacteriaceae bacterium]